MANRKPGTLKGYNCPKCMNRGYFWTVTDDCETVAVDCKCMAARRSLKLLEHSGLSSLVKRSTFDLFQTPEPWQAQAKTMAQEYAQNPDGGWFLANGQPGCGKTHLCVAICRELMLRGMETRYMLWRDEIVKIKAAANDSEGYKRIMNPLKNVPVLYIDDFLKCGRGAAPTDGDLNVAFELLNNRYIRPELLTIISTERSLDEIKQMDEALGSRIYERSRGHVLTLVGENKNWRMKENIESYSNGAKI